MTTHPLKPLFDVLEDLEQKHVLSYTALVSNRVKAIDAATGGPVLGVETLTLHINVEAEPKAQADDA